MLFRRFCRMFSLKLSTLIFSCCVIVSMFFSEELVSAFSRVYFVEVKRPIAKSGMLFVLGVSEPFKSVRGVTEEIDAESLFELVKDKLLLNT